MIRIFMGFACVEVIAFYMLDTIILRVLVLA